MGSGGSNDREQKFLFRARPVRLRFDDDLVGFINGGNPVPVIEVTTEASLGVIVGTLIVVIIMSLMSARGKALTTIKTKEKG